MIHLLKRLFTGERSMNWTQIAESYWVSPQLSLEDVKQAAESGMDVIVCNRPDGESADQITSADIKAAAEANGLNFVYLPMQGPNFAPEYLTEVKTLVTENKKVLAYCRSGNRSNILYNAAMTA
jgi:uncharacterized protein (TIGR01244 family)